MKKYVFILCLFFSSFLAGAQAGDGHDLTDPLSKCSFNVLNQVGASQPKTDLSLIQDKKSFGSLSENSDDILTLGEIKYVIYETIEFKDGEYQYRDITDDQYDNFITAMYSLEHLARIEYNIAAKTLFNYLCNKSPFNSPQLLGNW